jgi:hypothetical protein
MAKVAKLNSQDRPCQVWFIGLGLMIAVTIAYARFKSPMQEAPLRSPNLSAAKLRSISPARLITNPKRVANRAARKLCYLLLRDRVIE